MKPSKIEMFGTSALWAMGLGAILSEGFGVPFLETSAAIYIVIVAATWASWRSGHRAHEEDIHEILWPAPTADKEKQAAFRKRFEESGLAGKVLKWRGTDEDK